MDWDGKTERRAPATEIPCDPGDIHVPTGWHIKQEVIVALIGGFLVNLVLVIGAYYNLVGRQDLQQDRMNNLASSDARLHEEQQESMRLNREQFKELSAKIDRLIERGMK